MRSHRQVFETPRLYLCELSEAEDQNFFELNADPEVLRFTADAPFDHVEQARQFLRGYDHYANYGFGRWAVRLKETDAFLGWCGLRWTDEMQAVDLGFRFHQRYWGQGFATESARASIDYGFHHCGLDHIIGRSMAQNKASIRVLEKAGMRFWKEVTCDLHDALCYRVDRP